MSDGERALISHLIAKDLNRDDEIATMNAKREAMVANSDANYWKRLLSKPFEEIAKHDFDFRQAYEAQQEFLANWMVSQKAFKELAIQFGKEKGLTVEEVKKMGMDMRKGVLNNEFDPKHYTRVEESDILTPKIVEKLKAKL